MSHKPASELKSMIELVKQRVKIGDKYFHYKNPDKFYTITEIVIIEATDEIGIVYRAEYDDLKGVSFMRPIDDFLAEVEFNGEKVARFTAI